jgi:secernin
VNRFRPDLRVSCDSLVALGPRTKGGHTIFAKNSDRPAAECQPLFQSPARTWPEGSTLACQYIEIDQVPRTFAFIGARPAWLWGLEHGVNEHGVAIGNHTIFTRDGVADRGLLGMDLVRLGLERSATASAAAETIIELIERYGQGGSGYSDTHWPYHNSFLVADAKEAWLLEASASRWALRRADAGALSASNHATIGSDWDRLGHDTIEHAIAMDWWPEPTGVRFDFARAYRSTDLVPPVISSGRYATTCEALGGAPLDLASVRRVMRDHYDGGDVHVPGAMPDDPRYFSVCMHADPVGTTTASMIVELRADQSKPPVVWMALTNPCVSPYLPTFVDVPLPEDLTREDEGGAWRRFKVLLGEVEKDFAKRAPHVREFWKEFESGETASVQNLYDGLPADPAASFDARRELVERTWRSASRALTALTEEVGRL